MSSWQDLVDLYGRGGLAIITWVESNDTGVKRPALIRTVIQPDADVITWVPVGEVSPSIWARHHNQLKDKIRSMQRFRWLLKYAGFLFVVVPLTLYNVIARDLVYLVISLVLGAIIAFTIRFALRLMLRLYIRYQLEKLYSGLFGS